MEIDAIVENTSCVRGIRSVHGLSIFVRTKKRKILFDTGPNNTLFYNASLLGITLADIDTVVISHGHYDHGGALRCFIEQNDHAKIYIQATAFDKHYSRHFGIKFDIGLKKELLSSGRLELLSGDHKIDDSLSIFKTRECTPSVGGSRLYKGKEHDSFDHEQHLIVTDGGVSVLFVGCAHTGIVSILNSVPDGQKIDRVIGGFHLSGLSLNNAAHTSYIDSITKELKERDIIFHTCHCTGKRVFSRMKEELGEKLEYLAGGMRLKI